MKLASVYAVRLGQRHDAEQVRALFFSILLEHGFPPIKSEPNLEVVRFGSHEHGQDDFVAVHNHKVCGFAVLCPQDGDVGELNKVFVSDAHRHRGVGGALVERCLKRAKQRGYRQLVLDTHVRFVQARRYYESHGWVLESSASETLRYSYDLPISSQRMRASR